MYHKNWMSNYILKFKRDIRTLLDDNENVTFSGDEQVKRAFLKVVSMLNFQSSGFLLYRLFARTWMKYCVSRDQVRTLPSKYSGTSHKRTLTGQKFYGYFFVIRRILMEYKTTFFCSD